MITPGKKNHDRQGEVESRPGLIYRERPQT